MVVGVRWWVSDEAGDDGRKPCVRVCEERKKRDGAKDGLTRTRALRNSLRSYLGAVSPISTLDFVAFPTFNVSLYISSFATILAKATPIVHS